MNNKLLCFISVAHRKIKSDLDNAGRVPGTITLPGSHPSIDPRTTPGVETVDHAQGPTSTTGAPHSPSAGTDPRLFDPRLIDPRLLDPRIAAAAALDPRAAFGATLDPRTSLDPRTGALDPRLLSSLYGHISPYALDPRAATGGHGGFPPPFDHPAGKYQKLINPY